jgi:hypothetical protein
MKAEGTVGAPTCFYQGSWGYRHNTNFNEMLTSQDLIDKIAAAVSCGGNILLNVGPIKEGNHHPHLSGSFKIDALI